MNERGHTLIFLGTGASCGVPSFYCGCAACDEARDNPRAARDCSGLLIVGSQHTLIDAAPELRTQLIRERIGRVDRALFTHEHFDHVGGIPQLEFYARLVSKEPFPIYAGSETLAAIEQQFGFMTDALVPHPLEAFEIKSFDGVDYTPLPATHSKGAFGFLIEVCGQDGGRELDDVLGRDSGRGLDDVREQDGERELDDVPGPDSGRGPDNLPGTPSGPDPDGDRLFPLHGMGADCLSAARIAYFPDTGPLSPRTLERLGDLDILILDATFNGANWMPQSHHSIDEAIALAQALAPKRTFLTHLTMHYDEPITLAELEKKLEPYQGLIAVAHDGMRLPLP
jgi:phosphoribosyl 1,2-cyclic phosphodiesterase